MIIGKLETRNYEWTTLTSTPEEALENLRQAWENHSQYGSALFYTWEELQDSVTLTPLNLGDTITDCAVCENLAHHN